MNEIDKKFKFIIKLAIELEKTPRKYGTNEMLSPAEIHLIETIGDNNETLSVTDLGKLLGVTKGAVSQNLKRLETKNLTNKRDDPQNSSRSIVSLTSKGKTAFNAHKQWHKTMDGGFKEYSNNFDDNQIKFLNEYLTRIEDFFKKLTST